MKTTSMTLKNLQQDNLFVTSEKVSLSKITGLPVRKGMEAAIVSEGQIVNVVSDSYGHLPNEKFFAAIEEKLIRADVNFVTRSINRENRSFACDYILQDPNMVINIKNGLDKIVPMLRFTNSYDGSCKTSGHFGFFRQICSNGLHVSNTQVGFSVKHRGNIVDVVIPEVNELIKKFFDNEFYTLRKKFEVMAERPITDLEGFVKLTAEKLNLFKFASSDKNPMPSLNARTVIETIQKESQILGTEPNMWLGYNAFNELLHGKLKKTFEQQKNLDAKLMDIVSAM